MQGWIECAEVFLEWCTLIDYPTGTVSSNVCILGLCLPFSLVPELAVSVVRWCAPHVGLDGFRLSLEELSMSQNLGLPFHDPNRNSLFCEIGSAGRLIGPVDFALLLGSEQGAKALLAAGMPWSLDEFIELVNALDSHPTVLNNYVSATYKLFPVKAACQRARGWTESWTLDVVTSPGVTRQGVLRI